MVLYYGLYNALYRVYRGEVLRYLDAMRVLYVLVVLVPYRYIRCRACSAAPLPVTDSSVWTVANRVSDWPDRGISQKQSNYKNSLFLCHSFKYGSHPLWSSFFSPSTELPLLLQPPTISHHINSPQLSKLPLVAIGLCWFLASRLLSALHTVIPECT